MTDKARKISIIVGLIIGAAADGLLRFFSGDEGNLLVHSVVFLSAAFIGALAAYMILVLIKRSKPAAKGADGDDKA